MAWWDAIVDFIYHLLGYKKVTAVSILRTTGGTPVPGEPVTLSYAKGVSTSWATDGTNMTTQLGTVQNYVYLKSGTYTMRMSFIGAGAYRPCQAQSIVKV
jgi:hypothetical protein